MAHISLMNNMQPSAACSDWTSTTHGNEVELRIWNVDKPTEFDKQRCVYETVGTVLCGNAELLVGENNEPIAQGIIVGPNQSWSLPGGTMYRWKVKSVPFKAVIATRKLN